MAVLVGSARIDERGKATGGVAGDQTGKEISTQAWYKHSKGWNVLRCKDTEKAAKIAECMKAACASKLIGYDQGQRGTLYSALKDKGFDIAQLDRAVETDCSALVRVCCAYAGITVGNFRTTNEKSMLLATGEFDQLKGAKYENQADYLRAGDILVTKTQGHTVVVLNDGAKAETLKYIDYTLGDRELYNGCVGEDVRELQQRLIDAGFSCGDAGADAEFGDATELAVISFQHTVFIDGDGIVGKETLGKLMNYRPYDAGGKYLRITGDCWFRSAPIVTANTRKCVLKKNTESIRIIEHIDGWYRIALVDGGYEGYVSEKYAMEVNGL